MTKVLPIHPGEHLVEFLEEYGITQYRLAKEIHVPARRINEIVKGKRGISVDTAIRLSRYFGSSPQLWINLQSNYDIEITSKKIIDTINPISVAT
ncbi:MAG: HigA family addiction module antitoxin [Nitrosomonas sp.]|nr:HigA family addiction module antitoxin [Nitrosomonas sp.]